MGQNASAASTSAVDRHEMGQYVFQPASNGNKLMPESDGVISIHCARLGGNGWMKAAQDFDFKAPGKNAMITVMAAETLSCGELRDMLIQQHGHVLGKTFQLFLQQHATSSFPERVESSVAALGPKTTLKELVEGQVGAEDHSLTIFAVTESTYGGAGEDVCCGLCACCTCCTACCALCCCCCVEETEKAL